MPRLPGISQRDAVRVFEKLGYKIARQGSHIVMSDGKTRLIIPRHNPINAFTMGGLAKAAGLTPEEFRSLLLAASTRPTNVLPASRRKSRFSATQRARIGHWECWRPRRRGLALSPTRRRGRQHSQ